MNDATKRLAAALQACAEELRQPPPGATRPLRMKYVDQAEWLIKAGFVHVEDVDAAIMNAIRILLTYGGPDNE